MNPDKLDTLVIARAFTVTERATRRELAEPLDPFAPASVGAAQWRELLDAAIAGLLGRGIIDDRMRLRDRAELARRIGAHTVKRWPQLRTMVLPAFVLGIAADDARSHKRIQMDDGWAAAIAGRALGLWTDGLPPSLAGMLDALVWRELGLPARPARCPDAVRAHFIRLRLGVDADGARRLVRLLAAREAAAPRPDPGALRDALVRAWLVDRALGGASPRPPDPTPAIAHNGSFAEAVQRAAREARSGVFGDRNVFISVVWDQLRHRARWSSMTLDDFKARLVAAHRAGAIVLSRADYVAAMDPALVTSSETVTDGAEFHFIVREAS